MKKILFGLIAMVLFSLNANANVITKDFNDAVVFEELPQEVKIVYHIGDKKVIINKTFDSHNQEMKSFIETELEKINLAFKSTENALIHCSVTVHVGTANNYIEVTVSGECSAVIKEAKKLKAQLMSQL